MRRVVITGLGAVAPIGNTLAEFEKGLYNGQNGIAPITRFDTTEFKTKLGGEVKDLDIEGLLSPKLARKIDPYAAFGMIAADQAIKQSGIVGQIDPERIGVIVASGIGGILSFEEQHMRLIKGGPRKVSPLFVTLMISDIAAGQISIRHGLKGPNYCVVSACASAASAIGDAMRLIKYGDAEAIVAGGCEASIAPIAIAGFANMKALSINPDPNEACRPFDKQRDGFIMGEGAGILVLEEYEHARARGAKILAELAGYGATGDAYHVTSPPEGHEGAVRAVKIAVKDAAIDTSQIGHVNAHGTSTYANDKNESIAMRTVFGKHADDVIVSSTKSMTGHLLGASGGIEAVATLIALRRQEAPPTINYSTPDPECDLNYSPNTPTKHEFEYALSNSFGFGGHNAVLLFKRT